MEYSEYLKNPKLCRNCGTKILLNKGQCFREVKRKVFCSQHCSAVFNNKRRKIKRKVLTCEKCNTGFIRADFHHRKFCSECWLFIKDRLGRKTKSEASHSEIRAHARKVAKQIEKKCFFCGYNKFVEICHKTPVSSFLPEVSLNEMNNKDNLVALCPNCHWEFDHGLLQSI